MTVYVDDMYLYPMGKQGRMKMSHMIADTEAELHAMADKIGVARRWYQGDHYDVAMSTRSRAIDLGATQITLKDCALMSVLRRRDPHAALVTPDEGRAFILNRLKEQYGT